MALTDVSKTKTMTLRNEDFVHRFGKHINTTSIGTHQASRHSQQQLEERKVAGLTVKRTRKQACSNNKKMLAKCPCCKTGTNVNIDVFGKRGPPQKYFTGQQCVPVA